MLAVFVLFTSTGAYTEPLPAKLDNNSSWRVDDGGEFDSTVIVPLFALRAPDANWEVGVIWFGAEGAAITLYRTSPEGVLTAVAGGYQYTSPE